VIEEDVLSRIVRELTWKREKLPIHKGKTVCKVVNNENVVEAAPSQDVDIEATKTVSTENTIEAIEIKDQAISGFRLIEMSILLDLG